MPVQYNALHHNSGNIRTNTNAMTTQAAAQIQKAPAGLALILRPGRLNLPHLSYTFTTSDACATVRPGGVRDGESSGIGKRH